MGICLENVTERPARAGRFKDLTGYVTKHGIQVLRFRGMEDFRGRKTSVWDCQCPRCGKEFAARQNSLDIQKSCGCGHRAEYLSSEAKDLRNYHYQLMTNSSRLCERWQDADTFIADLEPRWVTGHILCRLEADRPFGPDNWTSCEAYGGTRKSRCFNVGTREKPDFWSSNRILQALKFSRTRLHALSEEQVIERVRSHLSRQSESADRPRLHPHPTESTSP